MNKLLIISTTAFFALGTTSFAGSAKNHLCNGNCQDKGEKKGWADDPDSHTIETIPRGLDVSGHNGRVDNGKGNGGENIEGTTPTWGGEDADWDDDPN